MNVFVEAFPAHEHLCIVSQYCSGGSLTTLRRATQGNRLEEKYILPIARELAFALRSVHAAGIVHRDVKCRFTDSVLFYFLIKALRFKRHGR